MSDYEDREPTMKGTYKITLLNGNHGIWLLVSGNDDQLLMEQSGLHTVEEALHFALKIISFQEKV